MFTLGTLTSVPASTRPDLFAAPTGAMLTALGLLDEVGVADIDPAVSDTAATRDEFGLDPSTLANCVVVGGRRDGIEKIAACVVLASTRADVNGTVKRLLDVRKASFLPMERAVELTGMEYGGITPIGLPADWPVYVDGRVIEEPVVIVGSGVRRSKILLPGALLARIPGVRVIEGLAREIA
ncbi:MAG TPA: YbaK/EbsC family protein [Lacisediminihabitans sp.]|uniref:YbaK/EbsC family protein n=1 Tax=Lacisediminihabitans sp. TaxID=2787631 RepID=UPI002ED9B7FA